MAEFFDYQKAEMSLWVITIVFESFFAYFFVKRSVVRRDVDKNFNFAVGLMFLGLVLTYSLRTLNDFYDLFNHNNVLMLISNIPFVLGTLPIVLYLEKEIVKKTKYIISGLLIISSTIFVIMSIISNFDPSTITLWVGAPTAIGVIFPGITYLYLVLKGSGTVRRSSFLIIIGMVLLATPMLVYMGVPLAPILIPLASLIGCLFLAQGFFGYPVELKWKEKLQELYVISQTGICLYAFSFEKNIQLEEAELAAGGFTGIQLLLSEITGTEEALHHIDYQNMKIIIEQGLHAVFVLIIKEESTYLQYKLKLFAERFQLLFDETLQHWDGRIDIFKPTRALIQNVYELRESIG